MMACERLSISAADQVAKKRLKQPRDPIARAKLIGDIATGHVEEKTDDGKNAAIVARGIVQRRSIALVFVVLLFCALAAALSAWACLACSRRAFLSAGVPPSFLNNFLRNHFRYRRRLTLPRLFLSVRQSGVDRGARPEPKPDRQFDRCGEHLALNERLEVLR
jgi:hypothetical protein